MNRDELIEHLREEIAKRDMKIGELENDVSYYAARNEELRAEINPATSPAGVDGLEVVAWMMKPDLYEPYVCIRRDSNCFDTAEPLVRLSDAHGVDSLRRELENRGRTSFYDEIMAEVPR